MVVYIKKSEKIEYFQSLLNIIKTEKIEDKEMVYLPIKKTSKNRKKEKVIEKLSKYLYSNSIKNIVLETELMQDENVKNILYKNNFNILDGNNISRFFVYDVIKKIYEYKKSNIEAGEVTLVVNENDNVNVETIIRIAHSIKRLNIITTNTKKFKKVVDYLYEELGILIKLSNNIKTNLRTTDIIINIDFPEEIINRLEIPNNAVIVNIPQNININSKKFTGINIKSWELEIPSKYKLEGFEDKAMYESIVYTKPVLKIFEQIEKDFIKIRRLIGVNGVINAKEFLQ